MQELISQLARLYLPAGAQPDGLAQHLGGVMIRRFDLARGDAVRAIVIPFDADADHRGAERWERLCEVANALQSLLGLPAPAVSVTGGSGFRLWLSFEEPVPAGEAQHLLDLLRAAYCPEVAVVDVLAPVELPPCRNPATGKWAAFIHPGMGASFADEPALDMAPPLAAQAAFLEGLQPISPAKLRRALDMLEPPVVQAAAEAAIAPPTRAPAPDALLLKDATLEDIVRLLHARGIEPTFRHLLPSR